MGKVSKATKKFQSKHLKRTLDHRKEVKKHNQLVKSHKSKRAGASTATKEDVVAKKKKSDEIFEDMDVEEFFDKGFEVPKESKKLKAAKATKKAEEEAEEESSSDEEVMGHQEDLEKLKEKDPEFYKYLKENDSELLDFNPTNPLEAMSDDEDDDEEEPGATGSASAFGPEDPEEYKEDKIEVTLKLVKDWTNKLESEPTLKLIKNILAAFKAAINVNKEDQSEYKYSVTDAKAFHELIILGLKKVPGAVQAMAPYKIVKGARTVNTKNLKVKQLNSILKSHAGALLTLLNDINNVETASLVLLSVQELLPYYLSFRRIMKNLVIAVVNVWSTTNEVEIQIASFAFLNNASKEFTKSILDSVLKQVYSSFIKNARKTNIHSMPLINFQKNSGAELFGIDETLAYQVGFDYIRQLAIHLRNSINNTKDGFKTIYNWQYVHSLDFWSRVLSTHCHPEKEVKKESPLRQLIYPLVQVTLGTIRLIPTAQFFPLRFYLIRSLIRLSQNSGVFIPLFPLLQEILNSTTLTKTPKNANLPAFDFDHNIKCNSQYLGTRTFQQGVCEQFIDLCGEYFVLYSKNISFPELSTPVIISLRRYIKTSKNVKFNKQLTNLVTKLNQNSEFILEKRAKVDFNPSNRSAVAKFLSELTWDKTPFGGYVVVQREVRDEKSRILRDSLLQEEEERRRAKEARNQQDEDDEDEDDVVMSGSDEDKEESSGEEDLEEDEE